jgi:PKD repeat protein
MEGKTMKRLVYVTVLIVLLAGLLPAATFAQHPPEPQGLTGPAIVVNPTSLSAEQCPDTQTSQTLQVCNGGTAPLTWSLVELPESKALGSATVNVPAGPATAPEKSVVALGPYTPRLAIPYTLERHSRTNAPPMVAMAISDSDLWNGSPIQSILLAYGDLGTVDLIDAYHSTPTLAQLQAYDVVLTWSNTPYHDPVGMGNVLADYVDGGGKVINLLFALLPSGGLLGRFVTGGYSAMTLSGWSSGTSCLGTYDPSNPIMEGVTNVCDLFRGHGTALTTGSTGVAWWQDNELFVAAKDEGSVVSINGYVGRDDQWTGQLPDVVHNTILWLASGANLPWLRENPILGTLETGQCADVTVTFDSNGLTPGLYTGDLQVHSNDPDTPHVDVPVSLTVLEAPSQADFSWNPPVPGPGQPVDLTGTATGSEPLTYDWDFGDGNTATGNPATNTYGAAGDYLVTLTVSNACGTAYAEHTVTVASPFVPAHINKDKINWMAAARPGYYKVVFAARIRDDLGNAASGTTVYGTWTYPDNSTHDKTYVTTALGQAKFPIKEPQAGVYTFCVTDISGSGYVYDPDANEMPACLSATVVP